MNVFEVLAMRRVRNECRQYMTHDTSHIGVLRQLRWWWFTFRPAFRRNETAGIVARDDSRRQVGYGLITWRDKRFWLSGGVVEDFRGQGLGQRLFTELIAMVESRGFEPWLDVRQDNKPARKLYAKLGFVRYGRYRDGIIVMVRRTNARG